MSAGVYVLIHSEKGLAYVGSSGDLDARCRSWSSILSRVERGLETYQLGSRVLAVVAGTRRSEWAFIVVEELEGASKAALLKCERDYIGRAIERFGDGCLNEVGADGEPLRLVRLSWEEVANGEA